MRAAYFNRRWFMNFSIFFIAIAMLVTIAGPAAGKSFQMDRIPTTSGNLEITFIGQGASE
jgi:hypothetical protein